MEHREGGKDRKRREDWIEGGRDGGGWAEKERERLREADIGGTGGERQMREAEALFRFQIWTGLGQIPSKRLGCAILGPCLGPRDSFLLPRPPMVPHKP